MTNEPDRIAASMRESLAVFARLCEQMRDDGPQAVVASLNSMPDSDVRQVLLALVVTSVRAEEEEKG